MVGFTDALIPPGYPIVVGLELRVGQSSGDGATGAIRMLKAQVDIFPERGLSSVCLAEGYSGSEELCLREDSTGADLNF